MADGFFWNEAHAKASSVLPWYAWEEAWKVTRIIARMRRGEKPIWDRGNDWKTRVKRQGGPLMPGYCVNFREEFLELRFYIN